MLEQERLRAGGGEFVATEVSPKINSSKVDEPGVRATVQGELF